MPPKGSVRGTTAVLLLAATLLTACAAAEPSHPRAAAPPTTTVGHDVAVTVLTATGADRYDYLWRGDSVTVQASPDNVADNDRQIFWSSPSVRSQDQQTCQTWDSVVDLSTEASLTSGRAELWQPGLALRIAPRTLDEPARAIVIDQNIWDSALWVVWIDLWQTTREGQSRLTGLVSFDLSAVLGTSDGVHTTMRPPPWHLCARVVGTAVSFKVWTDDGSEPSWDDPVASRHATLPEAWVYPGYTGGYVGHLRPGQAKRISDIRSSVLSTESATTSSTTP